ncbi:glycosyltransferase family 2 protein [Pseudoflavitalea sp. G-6-1-2]|uniref:glycosyltransferase family 2 protein n=1 Tax=Pseudoflavitalea sp. G-6-1-2 TaxID=2728841 RepID=UPI00146E0932|nr:glycosyltransferase family 2 protein [Pseudoflavitalea sp. G-6-1-2]NML21316.1 glycosyltransferase family 2 protein [Pseudoflavitalea sp. G-6-1-2]
MNRTKDQGKHSFGKVSAVIITFNEESNIRRTLRQLHWCDEIIVVDSHSTDSTVAICREFNATVYYRDFDGYGPQKRFAVSMASNPWVLCIDADEVLSDELVDEILQITPEEAQANSGFAFKMNLVFLGKEFKHGKESGRHFLRLFNKEQGGFTEDKVHEAIRVNGPVKKLNHILLHYSYHSFHQCLEKNNRYSTISAEMAFSKGKKKHVLAILFALPFNFFKYYLLERNLLNGLKGFYWSTLLSFYHFFKYVKLNELHRQAGKKSRHQQGSITISANSFSKAS